MQYDSLVSLKIEKLMQQSFLFLKKWKKTFLDFWRGAAAVFWLFWYSQI